MAQEGEVIRQAITPEIYNRSNSNRGAALVGPSAVPRVEVMIVPLVALITGIVSTRQVNVGGQATIRALEVEVMGVADHIAAVVKKNRRATKLQQTLLIVTD